LAQPVLKCQPPDAPGTGTADLLKQISDLKMCNLSPGGRRSEEVSCAMLPQPFWQAANKISGLSPQFPTKKFHNGSSWFILLFLKNANTPNEYAVFMNLRETSDRVQLPPPPPLFTRKS
jgi:hypothetical protein